MPLMRQAAPLTMGWCLDCHRNPEPEPAPARGVFDMAWTPPTDQADAGGRLRGAYRIGTEHLTDCSVCHR